MVQEARRIRPDMVKSENKIPGVIIIARIFQPDGVPKMGSESSAFCRVLASSTLSFVGQTNWTTLNICIITIAVRSHCHKGGRWALVGTWPKSLTRATRIEFSWLGLIVRIRSTILR